jgi:hypothetical protein
MSESYEPKTDATGGPAQRPSGGVLPPKRGTEQRLTPGADDMVIPGLPNETEPEAANEKPGGMIGEG